MMTRIVNYGAYQMNKKKNSTSKRGNVMSLVSIRGAITVTNNSKEEILEATQMMLEAIIENNGIQIEHIIQIHFSGTKDLDAIYPAVAARKLNITEASLMCFQEFYVVGSLEKCIRVDLLVEQEGLSRENVKHQYLRKAKCLRPDLVKESGE